MMNSYQFYFLISPIWLPILLFFIGLILISYDKKKLGKTIIVFGLLYAIVGLGMCSGLI